MLDGGGGPCNPALGLMAERAGVLPYELVTFVATGGTGAYRFVLSRNVSGAIINELTGAYLSGATPGPALADGGRQSDQVSLTDNGCSGTATAEVTVVPPMNVRPTQVELPPNGTFTFSVSNGLGPFTFEMVSSTAGGTVNAQGTYAVASGTGRDLIRVTDVGGNQMVDAVVDVVSGARLTPLQGRVALPVGATFRPVFQGGSGFTLGAVTGTGVTYADGLISGDAAGNATINVTDEFTGQSAVLNVSVLAPQTAPVVRAGDQTSLAWVTGAGDVTGDGRPDALLGMPEANVGSVSAGAVYLYGSSTNGLVATPVKIWNGADRSEQFGRQVEVADLNGDGIPDLVVTAPLADVGASDNGSVSIYLGATPQAGGIPWADTPSLTLSGRNAGDQFGTSVAVCDFNGDGRLDVAVGAVLAEDRTASPQSSNQGGVFIHLGYPDGLLPTADMVVWGQLPDMAGMWSGAADLRVGNALAAGDFDGDGLCDLAAGALNYRLNASSDGAVFVYKGVGMGGMTLGGVQPLPSLALAGTNPDDVGSNLGRYVAMGDTNGDGMADLLMSQYLHETTAGASQNPGGVRLWLGEALPTMPPATLRSVDLASWTWSGPNNGDNAGWWVHMGDANGDALADVVSGNRFGEAESRDAGPVNSGSVTVFFGVLDSLPATTPDMTLAGESSNDLYGQNAALLGDVNADGTADLLVLASRRDDYGLDVGMPYFQSGADGGVKVALEMPGVGAGQQLGFSADVVGDINGDGMTDLVVGSPFEDSSTGVNAGAAYVYLGGATGFSTQPDLTLAGFRGHGAGYRVGHAVSRAGDFNGDGIADIAVVGRNAARPGSFGAGFVEDTGGGPSCAGSRSSAGAVYVFLGSAAGLPAAEPAFVFYGPQAGQVIEAVSWAGDVDNDGFADLIVGSRFWDNSGVGNDTGGFAVVRGRATDPAGDTTVICQEALLWLGLAGADNVGLSVSTAGRINADNCDDMVVGAPLEDLGTSNQGTVRVILGWGGTGCPASATAVLLSPGVANMNAGYSVAGGHDVDGDGVPDIAVGAVGLRNGANTTGGVWLVPGAYVASLTAVALDATAANVNPIEDPAGVGVFTALGADPAERMGTSVVLVPQLGGGGTAAVAGGAPLSSAGGVTATGGVQVWGFNRSGPADSHGFTQPPLATLGGETGRVGGRLGEMVAAGRMGTNVVLVMGGYLASGASLDQGTAYAWVIPAP